MVINILVVGMWLAHGYWFWFSYNTLQNINVPCVKEAQEITVDSVSYLDGCIFKFASERENIYRECIKEKNTSFRRVEIACESLGGQLGWRIGI